jgi:superfamily II DNA or RNA helicase/HKD family nuclease/diadenosine tetraphosphate (Ap4A) HIT family hydrolase
VTQRECPFCFPKPDTIVFEDALIRAIWDVFPVSPGHILVTTKRHVADWFASSPAEQQALTEAISRARNEVLKSRTPDAFNVGINIGAEAGQTIPHLHVHLIPRYRGDVVDPRGGVRYVIPQKANYLQESMAVYAPEMGRPSVVAQGDLVRGGLDDPLIFRLRDDLAGADDLDMAVAFILPSGVTLLENHLSDLLAKGGRVRILTGDYQQTTDPGALRRLLDMEGRLDLRVHECNGGSFHPKAYIISSTRGKHTAYVGSSNLTRSGLRDGVEWNYRVEAECDPSGFAAIQAAFDAAFTHPSTREVTAEWIDRYASGRVAPDFVENPVEADLPAPVPEPHDIQKEALTALEATRAEGNRAGLVVLATGLGKTWLSAFDSKAGGFQRILFVAHREEILDQSLKTFRAIRPEARIGRYTGKEKVVEADILFASVQTLGRVQHLRIFDRNAFDYIVIDEFHHAAATTYRKIINYFEPKFLLGLTATPERTDGGDLLALCDENLVYTCHIKRGISAGLLSPFHYFGVPDLVDYRNIPWRNSRFDETELTNALATEARAENALEQLRKRGGRRALGFCCSVRHADFMARFVAARGVRAVAVHSGPGSAPRTRSLEQLRDGELDIVFTVDMFNEGVDVPAVDTVMMLRPTESRILWQQQFGRGLRVAEGKEHLSVIDYIGNHRTFLLKPQTLLGLGTSDRETAAALASYGAGTLALPPGCEVTYDLEAINILRALLRAPSGADELRQYYRDFLNLHGRRPSAVEAFHDGMRPDAARQEFGSWLGFVRSMDGLSEHQLPAFDAHRQLLEDIGVTPMTKSFKMVLLLAMLNLDGLPGGVAIDDLVEAFRARALRSRVLSNDVGPALAEDGALRKHLEQNPIDAWTGGRGTGGRKWFTYEDGQFRSTFDVQTADREPLQELVREICDWRLAQYLSNCGTALVEGAPELICRVRSVRGEARVELPSREFESGIPYGSQPVRANSDVYLGEFDEAALVALRKEAGSDSQLATILSGWFGSDAGQPGTDHRVSLRAREGVWDLLPQRGAQAGTGPELWKTYPRREIPGLFGLPYAENLWRQGFLRQNSHLFLLVTLHKEGMAVEHQYADKFIDRRTFEWQSQNRQARNLPSGRILRDHVTMGVTPHLFVRGAGKIGPRTAPFYYCGTLQFVSWEGDRPITVMWELENEVPESLYMRLTREQVDLD